jgi:hypothetical protein
VPLDFNSEPGVNLPDLNRDGFSDLLREGYYALPPSLRTSQPALGVSANGIERRDTCCSPQFTATIIAATAPRPVTAVAAAAPLVTFNPQIADLDADGFYDEVLFGSLANVATTARPVSASRSTTAADRASAISATPRPSSPS